MNQSHHQWNRKKKFKKLVPHKKKTNNKQKTSAPGFPISLGYNVPVSQFSKQTSEIPSGQAHCVLSQCAPDTSTLKPLHEHRPGG